MPAIPSTVASITGTSTETSNNVHAYFPKLPFPSAMRLPQAPLFAAQALQCTQVNNTVEAARTAITAAQSRINPPATPARLEPMNMEGPLPYGTSCPAPEGRPRPRKPGPKPKPKPDTASVEPEPRRRRTTTSIIVLDSEEEDNSEDDYIPSPTPVRPPQEELEAIEQPPAKKKKQMTKTLAPKKQYNGATRKQTGSAVSQVVADAEATAGAAEAIMSMAIDPKEARTAQIFADASFIISLAAFQADLYDRTVRARMEQRAHYCNFQAQYPHLVNPWEGMVGIELPDDLQITNHNLTPYLPVLQNALTSIQSRMYSR